MNERKRRQFDRAYKVEAVRLITEGGRGVVAVSRDLGVSATLLHRWKKEFSGQGTDAFVGTGNLTPEQAELRVLRRENADLREERDILKKAISVFSDRRK